MKTIIAGSRSIKNQALVEQAVKESGFRITEVVSGTAKGVDQMGEDWANKNNLPIKRFPAEWNKHGKKAGYIRNEQMADYANALIAIWDGESKGTKHMIWAAQLKGLQVYVLEVNKLESLGPIMSPEEVDNIYKNKSEDQMDWEWK